MLVISTNLSQLSDLNWVMRIENLFLCLTATASDQSAVKFELNCLSGNDYYAWKILITGGRTCPDECFQWLDNNWCSVSYNSRLLIFPFPHIYPCLVDRNIIPRNAGVYLIQQVNLQVTEISDRILWISHGYLVCRNSRLETVPPHTHHLTSTSDAENMKLPKEDYAMQPPVRGSRQANNTQRGLCCENLRITRTAAMTFCLLYYFLGAWRLREQAGRDWENKQF